MTPNQPLSKLEDIFSKLVQHGVCGNAKRRKQGCPDCDMRIKTANTQINRLITNAIIEDLEILLRPTWTAEQWQPRAKRLIRDRIKELKNGEKEHE